MKERNIVNVYTSCNKCIEIANILKKTPAKIYLKGLCGSTPAFFLKSLVDTASELRFLVLLQDKEKAAFFYHDLEILFNEEDLDPCYRHVFFFPSSYKKSTNKNIADPFQILLRTQTITRISQAIIIVSYPESVCEKVISTQDIKRECLTIKKGESLSMDDITDFLSSFGFEYSDFVCQPGDYAVRGGIVDVYSFLDEHPYRIVFDGNNIQSIRLFDISTQESIENIDQMMLIPKPGNNEEDSKKVSLFSLLDDKTCLCIDDIPACANIIDKQKENFPVENSTTFFDLFTDSHNFLREIGNFSQICIGNSKPKWSLFTTMEFHTKPQDSFNQNFDLLIEQWLQHYERGILNIFGSDNANQRKRIKNIISEVLNKNPKYSDFSETEKKIWEENILTMVDYSLHEGFIEKDRNIAFYTDHQVFNRYHRFRIEDKFQNKGSALLKDLNNLQIGDYITHIDYGVGQYAGLEKIDINGHTQEAVKILYKNNDELYISIHSLHKISKYIGKEGSAPNLSRIGSNHWNKIKERTKNKVKEMVIDLTKLYAERRKSEGFAFCSDSYLQQELEASFIYEDTPDQIKATKDVKKDMEAEYPMDRLICGDVGFGKTEVAIRAAFKAVCDSKQVAILVPTTILALQHFHSFKDRLEKFPCKIAYLNRFTPAKIRKEILEEVKNGKIDILIGTHKILGKDVEFKDLGLLIIDEEQKFGVEAKEKLRSTRVNVDTLTLTATPIPRTLQFSLMGARDISIMQTPPLNRYPVHTEIHCFDENFIKEGISQEICRGGQVFFVNNRIQNLQELAGMIQKDFPEQSVVVAHGQMEGNQLEKIMIDFIDGLYDILVCTTIIESGLDIPNANTIFINDAQNYGLSDLHQMRGRVGRKNKQAFCYLLAPPLHTLNENSQKRLRAIEEFSDIGSGFHIAMRDLDIRGAGNLLGAEQSGFITEIGYEMYQKILEEAIFELNQSKPETIINKDEYFVKDCTIETDLEILIPDTYVSNVNERLILYKEINALKNEDDIGDMQKKMTDRFGKVPPQTMELFNSMRLRWLAKKLGFEKIVMKNGNLTCHFISNQQSNYFESEQFQNILSYMQSYPDFCNMKEEPGRLTIHFRGVNNVKKAILKLEKLLDNPSCMN